MTEKEKLDYVLRLADTVLIHGQRMSEWCGHGPVLEEDIALANQALDLLGQASNLLKYAAQVENKGRDEDALAFLRDENEFRNFLMMELPNGDYAFTIARQFLFSQWYFLYLRQLENSTDEFLRGFAKKSIKEVGYHLQHSSDWVKRMGDGTEESHNRIQNAVAELWNYTAEFFETDSTDLSAIQSGIGVDVPSMKGLWAKKVEDVLTEATLKLPQITKSISGGRSGKHTSYMADILSEMQMMQRQYPGAKW